MKIGLLEHDGLSSVAVLCCMVLTGGSCLRLPMEPLWLVLLLVEDVVMLEVDTVSGDSGSTGSVLALRSMIAELLVMAELLVLMA